MRHYRHLTAVCRIISLNKLEFITGACYAIVRCHGMWVWATAKLQGPYGGPELCDDPNLTITMANLSSCLGELAFPNSSGAQPKRLGGSIQFYSF